MIPFIIISILVFSLGVIAMFVNAIYTMKNFEKIENTNFLVYHLICVLLIFIGFVGIVATSIIHYMG